MDNSNQPVMPQQPMSPPPVPGPVGTPYAMPPKKGLSKGALWGIIGGSIGLVLLIVGIILAVVLLGGPSRDDYKAALDNTQKFAREMESYTRSLSTPSDADDAKAKVDDAVKKANEYIDNLGKEKAMRDPEVKKAYDEMAAEYKKAFEEMPLLPKIMQLQKCGYKYISPFGKTFDEAAAELEKETRDCRAALKELENESDEDIKNYIAKQKKYLEDYKSYLQKRVNKDYSARFPEFPGYSERSKILTKISDAGKRGVAKEKALVKLLAEKADVDVIVF